MMREDRRVGAAWLLLCAAVVFAIVVVGGVTRLTRSGLSIVEWQPLVGALPPLSEADWQALFAKYRETPPRGPVVRGGAAGGRPPPAALGGRLAGAVRQVPRDPRVPPGELRYHPRGLQAHLPVGGLP